MRIQSHRIDPASYGVMNLKETNDCTVRALANAKNIPYETAHETLLKHGRKARRGAIISTTHKAYTEQGFICTGVFGTTQRASIQKVYVPSRALHKNGITLGKLLPTLSNGRYIVMVTGHAFAVVNGQVIDQSRNSSNKSVFAVYKLEQSNENA